MNVKFLKWGAWVSLTLFALVGGIALFLFKDIGGDIDNVFWRFIVTKVHLAQQWAMPYLTPTRCGGFHLAADAQDLIFTLYTPISWIIPNVVWAVKITNVLLTGIFICGLARLQKILGVADRLSRYTSAVIIAFSGYWIYHMTQGGNIWSHGLAYTPWVLLEIEWLLGRRFQLSRRHIIHTIALSIWLMLLINSGYYWLQVGLVIIACRAIVEVILILKYGFSHWQRWVMVCLAGGLQLY